MKRRSALIGSTAALASPWPIRIRAQTRAHRVGTILPEKSSGVAPPWWIPTWKSMGWTHGENLLEEARFAEWHPERMPELADELLRRHGAELLLTFGPEATAAAARATRTVPIVFFHAYLPVESGLIDSYARPGRNATGIAWLGGMEGVSKRTDYFRAAAPTARRLAIFGTDTRLFTVSGEPLDIWGDVRDAAKARGFDCTIHITRRLEDVDAALAEAIATRAEVVSFDGMQYTGRASSIATLASHQRWVTGTNWTQLLDAGLLLYFAPADVKQQIERAIRMCDQVLRGARPADIPVEMPTRWELVVNLKAARTIGIVLPQALLLRADRVIE